MRLILFLNAMIFGLISHSQSTYLDSTYDLFNGTEYASAIFKNVNGNYDVFGLTYPHASGFKPAMMQIDGAGNQLYEKGLLDTIYNTSAWFTSTNYIHDLHGGYFFASSTQHSGTGEINTLIIRYNNLGDTIFTKRIPSFSSSDWYVNAVVQNSDSSYVLAGQEYISSSNSRLLIVKLDKNGNYVWHSIHGTSSDMRKANGICLGANGYLVAGYRTVGADFYPYVCKVDLVGNLIWQETGAAKGQFNNIKNTSDGNYMAVGTYTHYSISSVNFLNEMAQKISDNGTTIWQKTFGRIHRLGELLNFIETSDNNYLFIGAQGGQGDISMMDALIHKTTVNGDSIWTRVYDRCGLMSIERYADIIEKADGGFILAGSFYQGCNPDFWIVQVDSLGCHIPGCDFLSAEHLNSEIDFNFYPNPVKDIVNIETSLNDYSLTIYNLNGTSIKSFKDNPKQIDIRYLLPGIYLFEMKQHTNSTIKRLVVY